ncbi:MATE family efflux transporter [candidate division KSB1 bacterium]|nr:MATE family efflux transporter [candidate division KSB1 bacterium]
MSMGFVDTVMAGNLSARDLAAVAIGNSLFSPLFLFVMGVLMAINPIVAHLHGSGERQEIGRELWQGLWLSQVCAVPVFFIFRNMTPVMRLFDLQPEIIPIAQGYLNAFSFGLPAAFAYFSLRFFNEGLHITKPGMYFALIGLLFNIVGNYVFMYGHLGFRAMGAVGTGWATALVQWIMFACMLAFTLRKKSDREFNIFRGLHLPHWSIQKEILRVGVPNGVSIGIEVSLFAVVALIMGSLGIKTVAAHQVTINFAAMTFMIPLGLSFATTARVGFAMGRGDLQQARLLGFISLGLAVLIMSVTAFFMMTMPEKIVAIYTRDLEVKNIAVKLLFLAGIFQISDGLQVMGFGALRGLKDTRIPMFVNIFAYWVVGFSLGYYLGIVRGIGAEGLWIGLIAGLTVAAILHNWRFNRLTSAGGESNSLSAELQEESAHF